MMANMDSEVLESIENTSYERKDRRCNENKQAKEISNGLEMKASPFNKNNKKRSFNEISLDNTKNGQENVPVFENIILNHSGFDTRSKLNMETEQNLKSQTSDSQAFNDENRIFTDRKHESNSPNGVPKVNLTYKDSLLKKIKI